MAAPSDQAHDPRDEPGDMTVEDAEAEERATDEGMPEPPGGATSKVAVHSGPGPAREPITPPDTGRHGSATDDETEDDDGGYDLGGEA